MAFPETNKTREEENKEIRKNWWKAKESVVWGRWQTTEWGERQADGEVSRTGGRRKGSESKDREWVNIKSLLQRSRALCSR